MTKRHRRKRNQLGFTLIELLVVISVISLLIALLMPALSRARDQARTITCLTQQRQFGYYLLMYTQDYDNWLVAPYDAARTSSLRFWEGQLNRSGYMDKETRLQILVCPADDDPHIRNIGIPGETAAGSHTPVSYLINRRAGYRYTTAADSAWSFPWRRLDDVSEHARAPILVDGRLLTAELTASADYGSNNNFGKSASYPAHRHNNSLNLLYLGGNASTFPHSDPPPDMNRRLTP